MAKRKKPDKAAFRGVSGRVDRRGRKAPDWIAPDDMADTLLALVKSGEACGAKLKSTNDDENHYCSMPPCPNQTAIGRQLPHRCRFHGGATPVGVKNATGAKNSNYKGGLYSAALLPGEEAAFAEILKDNNSSNLDREIAMVKLRLQRAMNLETEQYRMQLQGAAAETLEVSERTDSEDAGGPDGLKIKWSEKREQRPYGEVIHRMINELVKLHRQKTMLVVGEELGADDYAARIRAMVSADVKAAKAQIDVDTKRAAK